MKFSTLAVTAALANGAFSAAIGKRDNFEAAVTSIADVWNENKCASAVS